MPRCKKVYLYRESRLPEEGWIQSCFHCYMYTSNTIDYTYIKHNNILYACDVYLCESCDKYLHKLENIEKRMLFENKCTKYLYRLFFNTT